MLLSVSSPVFLLLKWIESSHEKKDMGLLTDEKLNIRQQCVVAAQESQKYPRLHQNQPDQQVGRSGSAHLLCSYDTLPGVLLQFWGP